MRAWARAAGAAIVCLSSVAMTHAAELVVLTSQGNGPGVNALAVAFSRASGHKVTVLNEVGNALAQRLDNGPADLIALNPPQIEELVKKGKVVGGSVTPYMLAGLGVSVRAGAPKPDISTVDAYKATLLAAKSIGYSRGCSGQHVALGIAKLGIAEQIKPKVQLTGGGSGPVTFFLARGDFELGLQQTNIMVGAPGTDFVGNVPKGIDIPCPNSVGLLTVSKEKEAAQALIRFMTSPEAAPLLRKVHEEPARG
jgi:molybdate transport system substrate-binding protein